MHYYQQGDVLIKRVENHVDLKGAQKLTRDERGRLVLVEGEHTGHAHAISTKNAQLYQVGLLMYLVVHKLCTVEHEEHDAIDLLPGTYEIGRVREINPLDKRIQSVQD